MQPAEYQAVLEQEIARVVARQEDIGLPVVTDGELARSSWFGFFFEGLDGFRLEPSHFTVQGCRRLRLRVADLRGRSRASAAARRSCCPSSSAPTPACAARS